VATVAYTFNPAAKLIAVSMAKSALEGILTASNILCQVEAGLQSQREILFPSAENQILQRNSGLESPSGSV
jgi:hypothetical protein